MSRVVPPTSNSLESSPHTPRLRATHTSGAVYHVLPTGPLCAVFSVCAAKGELPGQGSRTIQFSTAPKSLRSEHTFDKCLGYIPGDGRARGGAGWANNDIFFLEVCLFNQICNNGPALFSLEIGEAFVCDLSIDGFKELQSILAKPVATDMQGRSACASPPHPVQVVHAPGVPSCQECWSVYQQQGDCSSRVGCTSTQCEFCTDPVPMYDGT